MLFAKTKQDKFLSRLATLFASAVALINGKNRSAVQIEEMLSALQRFKEAPKEEDLSNRSVAIKVGNSHHGGLQDFILILQVKQLSGLSDGLNYGSKFHFENTAASGWSWGTVLFVLDEAQSTVIVDS